MIIHHFSNGQYAKEVHIDAGGWGIQHRHTYDHMSILASGSIELIVDGETTVFHAPVCMTIKAGKHHAIKALTNVVWFCIHKTDCLDVIEIDNMTTELPDNSEVQKLFERVV